MTPSDKAALRALAEAATQPRSAFDGQFWDFHNAVTPAAVLSLLGEVERLREALEVIAWAKDDGRPGPDLQSCIHLARSALDTHA